jgi:hypothetical protein
LTAEKTIGIDEVALFAEWWSGPAARENKIDFAIDQISSHCWKPVKAPVGPVILDN